MTTPRLRRFAAGALLALLLLSARTPDALADEQRVVALELVLAVDTSASVDEREYRLQREGVALAFLDPVVVRAIEDLAPAGLAVALVEWAGSWDQGLAVDWMQVTDAESAAQFSNAVRGAGRQFIGQGTSISAALDFSARHLEENAYDGRRRIIDISGDGRNNSGRKPESARDALVAKGITINGLPILDGDKGLGRYYIDRVTGGTASFVVVARDFRDFARAIREKLLRELRTPMAGLTQKHPSLIVRQETRVSRPQSPHHRLRH